MYMDMLQFSRRLYLHYANPNEEESRRVKRLKIGSNMIWEST
jgi:hypothetical protein